MLFNEDIMENKKIDMATIIINTLKVCVGLLISGIGTAFMFNAGQGSAPAATITEGISVFTGFNYGISGIIVNVFFLIILLIFDRKLINVGTVLATFFLGYFIDLGVFLLAPLNIIGMGTVLKTIMMLIGCIITAIGLGYYIGVDFGTGAMDGMSVILNKRLKIPFTYCRWGMDALLMIIGVILGASWGLGTVASIVLTGPIMSYIINKMKKE